MKPEPDDKRLMDHDYDGIQEYDNPIPRWWAFGFYATIVFGLLYWINVPGIGSGKGRIANYERDVEAARVRAEALAAEHPVPVMDDAALWAASRDPAVIESGRKVFTETCVPCHRADGGGSIGPNLTDDFWIHGGRPTEILHTVSTGVLEKGMPAWSEALSPDKVQAAAAYVLTLWNTHPPDPKAPEGTRVDPEARGIEGDEAHERAEKPEHR